MAIPFRLYWFHQPGCPSCAAAKPLLDRWLKEHPEAIKLDIHAGRHFRSIAKFKPKATPSYLIIPSGERFGVSHEGPLTGAQLDGLLAQALGNDEPEGETDEDFDARIEDDEE